MLRSPQGSQTANSPLKPMVILQGSDFKGVGKDIVSSTIGRGVGVDTGPWMAAPRHTVPCRRNKATAYWSYEMYLVSEGLTCV